MKWRLAWTDERKIFYRDEVFKTRSEARWYSLLMMRAQRPTIGPYLFAQPALDYTEYQFTYDCLPKSNTSNRMYVRPPEGEDAMIDDDVILSPGWCPLCGEPQTICDRYGDCERAFRAADDGLRDTVEAEREGERLEGRGSDEEILHAQPSQD